MAITKDRTHGAANSCTNNTTLESRRGCIDSFGQCAALDKVRLIGCFINALAINNGLMGATHDVQQQNR